MGLKTIAEDVGKGLVAGLAGTLAITVSQTIEMKITGRKPSTVPADAAGKALGVQATGDAEKQRFATIVHFGYGTLWGVPRGLLGAAAVSGAPATLLHFLEVWGAGLVMLPSLGLSPPVTEWENGQVAVEGVHHLVYAIAANTVYQWLDNAKK